MAKLEWTCALRLTLLISGQIPNIMAVFYIVVDAQSAVCSACCTCQLHAKQPNVHLRQYLPPATKAYQLGEPDVRHFEQAT